MPIRDYFQTIKEITKYDVALIIEAPCIEGIFLPTKVIDYLQCQIPIATCSPTKGVLNDLYSKYIIDYFSDINDQDSIYSMLIKITHDFRIKKQKSKNVEKELEEMQDKNVVDKYIPFIN